MALVCFVLPLSCPSDKTPLWGSLVHWRFFLFLPLGSLPIMRNRDGVSAKSEAKSLAVLVLRSGLPLQLTPKLPSWQLLEQDSVGGVSLFLS